MKRLMTKILNLPGVIVEESLETEETIILSVIVKNKTHLVRDLPITNREVILKVNRRQFKCEGCKKPFSEILDFVELRKNFTRKVRPKYYGTSY